MSGVGNWCLIESDPGVFTELISCLGVKNVQVEEIYSLDTIPYQTVYGLIFLFKYQGAKQMKKSGKPFEDEGLFFANQVITNACATQAILSVLLNQDKEGIELGKELKEFKEFTKEFDSQMKGLSISNSDLIRTVHNSFSRQESLLFQQSNPKQQQNNDGEDLFHFVSFIPFKGKVLELDGLNSNAIEHGDIEVGGKNWIEAVTPVIEMRIKEQQDNEGEIRFNLMALINDQEMELKQRIKGAISEEEINDLDLRISIEQEKKKRIRKENARRKFNFIPLIFKLLEQHLAKE